MPDDTPLSPLRRVLYSHSNAVRVARWMRRDGIDTAIVATDDPLQPWRIVEATTINQDTRACA
ncbi:hypothetical protein [Sphingomonas sp. CFBP 8760]|uniref:hypothetical protein n=1 Tax=Sphingomonas sp. CFBP 8760 TaxID=2775282 RepID=UPI00177F4C05|nr:hypothetical protein [Sphingomonas sp. CFBP 8760]MBD8546914.1 hypothetical protein [Sphingomonas sp. CFBP 8760]